MPVSARETGILTEVLGKQKLSFLVFFIEGFHSTSSANKYLFTGIKWVAIRANFHFKQWVSVAIFPNYGFFAGCAALGKKLIV